MPERFTEQQIKAHLLTELRQRRLISTRTLIANEFVVGKTSVRADLALFGQRFTAVEIKSEIDSLRRVRQQLEVYKAHFDEVILVLAARHIRNVPVASLDGVGVWTLDSDGEFRRLRPAPLNPNSATLSFMPLLTRKEARRVVSESENAAAEAIVSRRIFGQSFSARFASLGVTTLGIGIAILALWGYSQFKTMVHEAAQQAAVKKVDEELKDGKLRSHTELIVTKFLQESSLQEMIEARREEQVRLREVDEEWARLAEGNRDAK